MPTIGKQSIPGSRSTPSSRIGPFDRRVSPVLLLLLPLPRGRTFSRPGPAAYRHTRVLCPTAYILTVRASCVPQETRSLGPLQRHTTTHVLIILALYPPRTRSPRSALTYCLLRSRDASLVHETMVETRMRPPISKFHLKSFSLIIEMKFRPFRYETLIISSFF